MTTPTSAANRETRPGPGRRLAQAREDLRLGLEDVAGRLHLSARQIESLERDDYQNLPGPTYVRGYLKSYAMLLGIDPGPILEAHAQLTVKPSAPPDFSTIAPQREITSHHHQIRIVTYLVAVIVIGLAIAWWQGRSTPTPSPLAIAPEPETVPPAESAEPPRVPGVPVPAGDAAPPVLTPLSDARPAAAPPPAAPVPTPAAISAPPAAATPAPAAATPLPQGPRGTLVVHADQDTWLDVRDARQVKLIYETVPAGRSVTLEGIAPISVFLGNAAGVRVEYNGRAVDIAPHRRGMVARFTMGEEAASAGPSP